MNILDYHSSLVSARFGFKIAKVSDFNNDPESILNFIKSHDYRLVISKINCENLELINKLESLGFMVKDIQVTYKYDLKNFDFDRFRSYKKSNVLLRDANYRDIEKLERIAYEAFKNYGHYSADKRLEPKKCNEIYKDWIKRSVEDNNVADKIIIAEINGEVAGFLTFKLFNGINKYAAGGLGAVAAEFRNNDIFRLITIEGLHWGKEIGLEWEEHNVLITNYPVNRSFSKLEFKINRSFLTMHYWIA